MPPEYLARVKETYKEWRAAELQSFGGYIALNFDIGVPKTTSILDAPPDEWRGDFEERWTSGGLSYYTTYPDVFSDQEANDLLTAFVREKSRERIADPALAEVLLTKDFPILTKRLVADNGYYEAFARDNVSLVDVRSTPMDRITENGIRVGGVEHELDAIVLATGYDAVTGAMLRIDIRGRGGKELSEHWQAGPRTHLGLMSAGFPNMFIIDGPGSPGASSSRSCSPSTRTGGSAGRSRPCARRASPRSSPRRSPRRSGPSTCPRSRIPPCSRSPTAGKWAPTSRANRGSA